MINYIIVGAGISGLSLAKKLNDVVVLEKSRAIGGRIASRRLDSVSVDHGSPDVPHELMKEIAHDLTIHKEWEVSSFTASADGYDIHSSSGKTLSAKNIIFSSPAPQTKLILQKSGIEATFLNDVSYHSEIQFMVLAPFRTNLSVLKEWLTVKRLTAVDESNALVFFTLKPEFLDIFMEISKEDIKHFFLNAIEGKVIDSHAHKWKYSQVRSCIDPKYQLVLKPQNIFLMGDYFGINGVDTSLKSAERIYAAFFD